MLCLYATMNQRMPSDSYMECLCSVDFWRKAVVIVDVELVH
jgi:hypothetical protein